MKTTAAFSSLLIFFSFSSAFASAPVSVCRLFYDGQEYSKCSSDSDSAVTKQITVCRDSSGYYLVTDKATGDRKDMRAIPVLASSVGAVSLPGGQISQPYLQFCALNSIQSGCPGAAVLKVSLSRRFTPRKAVMTVPEGTALDSTEYTCSYF